MKYSEESKKSKIQFRKQNSCWVATKITTARENRLCIVRRGSYRVSMWMALCQAS